MDGITPDEIRLIDPVQDAEPKIAEPKATAKQEAEQGVQISRPGPLDLAAIEDRCSKATAWNGLAKNPLTQCLADLPALVQEVKRLTGQSEELKLTIRQLHAQIDREQEVGHRVLLECARLEKEVKRLTEQHQHTKEWYGARFKRLQEWARKELVEPLLTRFFSIIANGTADAFEPPTYVQMFNMRGHEIERLTAELAVLRADNARLRELVDSAVTDFSKLNQNELADIYREELAKI